MSGKVETVTDSYASSLWITMRKYPYRAISGIALPIIAAITAPVIYDCYPGAESAITTFFKGAHGTIQATAISCLFLFYLGIFAPAFRSSPPATLTRRYAKPTREQTLAEHIMHSYDVIDTNIKSSDPYVIARHAQAYFLGEDHFNLHCKRDNARFIKIFWTPGSRFLREANLDTVFIDSNIIRNEILLEKEDVISTHELVRLNQLCTNLIVETYKFLKSVINDPIDNREPLLQTTLYFHCCMLIKIFSILDSKRESAMNRFLNAQSERNQGFARVIVDNARHIPFAQGAYMFVMTGLAHLDPQACIPDAVAQFKHTLGNDLLYVSLRPKLLSPLGRGCDPRHYCEIDDQESIQTWFQKFEKFYKEMPDIETHSQQFTRFQILINQLQAIASKPIAQGAQRKIQAEGVANAPKFLADLEKSMNAS